MPELTDSVAAPADLARTPAGGEVQAPETADTVWKLYQEHCMWERHHESQRASITTILVAVAAAIFSVVAHDKAIAKSDLPLTLFLIMQGLFGATIRRETL